MRLLALLAMPLVACAAPTLSNEHVSAQFNGRGLVSLRDMESRASFRFPKDEFAVTLSGKTFDSATLAPPEVASEERRVTFAYAAGDYRIEAIYELEPEWRFVSKRIVITGPPEGRFTLDAITLFRGAVSETVSDAYTVSRAREDLGTGDYGVFLRFERSRGLLVTAQNPFLAARRTGNEFTLSYKPEMPWDMGWGPFESDRGLLAPYERTGRSQPEKMHPEWSLPPASETPGLDEAEVETFTELVRAFLLYKPEHPLNLMVGWCVNDYQIDIADAAGRAEYRRVFDRASQMGAEHVLFAPSNSEISRRTESRDDWHWENLLWLGLGQKIRRGEWDLATGAIPAAVRELLDDAKARRLGVLAYVYPVLLGGTGERSNLGVRSVQDWLIKALEDFMRHTGITGYSFDHTFLRYDGASRYAQWWGWRRVMETLRRDVPEIVIDGRQAYHLYGPWTWLAGNYPHPMFNDEQAESFVSFPDLKLDRVSANRERYTAYRYRNYEFAPSEIVPGFITHQTGRNDDSGRMPSRRIADDEVLLPFRVRDWDYLGWRYSLLSSIAIAGWNNVINMIPARDAAEFEHFSAADRQWVLHWLDFADANKEYLRHTRTILGQPAIGKIDGTAAIVEDSGYVFLFNPNGRRLSASFTLDKTIGLGERGKFLIRELYPLEGRLIGKAGEGVWSAKDTFMRELDGGSAMVLQIEPAEDRDELLVYNAPGQARMDGRVLRISGVRGEAGTAETLLVEVPTGRIDALEVNGVSKPVRFAKPRLVEVPVQFAGEPFRHYQQVEGGTLRIPQRVFDQLDARRAAWPIPWTAEDLRSTWLAPERLLLYAQFAEPDDRWQVSLKIDGEAVEMQRAYASVRANRRNFTGFYADISRLAPGRDHRVELELPPD